MLHNTVLSKENLDTIFESFADKCLKLGSKEKINVYVVGGGAILLNFDYRLSTMDIDALFSDTEIIRQAIQCVALEFNMSEDWLNKDFVNTPSFSNKIKDVSVLYRTYLNIVNVFYVPPIYLIAMKLKSSRPTGGDLDDIIKMIYELRLKEESVSYEMIIDAYNYLYSDFSNTYSYFIDRMKDALDTPIEEVREIMIKRYID